MNISVIIPVCEFQSDLQKAHEVLIRVLRNLSLEFEVLICDDTASSQSHVVCKLIKDRGAHTKIFLHEKRLGLGQSLRELFTEAKGDIVLYLNPRALFDYQALAVFLNSVRQCDVIVSSHYKAKEGEKLSLALGERLYSFFCRFLLRIPICEIIPSLMLVRRKVFAVLPLKASGEDFLTEFLARAHGQGFLVREVNFGFPPKRRNGFFRFFSALNFRKQMSS
ncbi:MAG: glycosyltransferase [Candidatus Aceula meridiana]|nr:glycosyltransferase [Candidatus Aceula meridiana]